MEKMLFFLLVTMAAFGQNATGIRMENVIYPFPVSEFPLNLQGKEESMAYMDVKPTAASNGKTVLLLHGKNFSGLYWERTAKDLAAKGYRVVMPDQIGFGKSTKPEIQYSFQQLARNTKKLLDHLGVAKTAVLGHSMGGMLSVRFALMYPETTEKLILENPIGLEDWKRSVPYASVDDWYAIELAQTPEKMKDYQRTNYYGGQWKPEYDRWLEPFAALTRTKGYPALAKVSALTYEMIFTQPVLYEFDLLKVPTLLIIGQRDRTALGKANAPAEVAQRLGNYPELGKRTAKAIAGSVLVELDGVGHLPHVEAYERFLTPLVAFLEK